MIGNIGIFKMKKKKNLTDKFLQLVLTLINVLID